MPLQSPLHSTISINLSALPQSSTLATHLTHTPHTHTSHTPPHSSLLTPNTSHTHLTHTSHTIKIKIKIKIKLKLPLAHTQSKSKRNRFSASSKIGSILFHFFWTRSLGFSPKIGFRLILLLLDKKDNNLMF